MSDFTYECDCSECNQDHPQLDGSSWELEREREGEVKREQEELEHIEEQQRLQDECEAHYRNMEAPYAQYHPHDCSCESCEKEIEEHYKVHLENMEREAAMEKKQIGRWWDGRPVYELVKKEKPAEVEESWISAAGGAILVVVGSLVAYAALALTI